MEILVIVGVKFFELLR